MKPFAIHWFRRDLRLAGNPALEHSRQKFGGRVLGLFCFDSTFLRRPDFSHHRFAFFLKTIVSLREEMRAQGGDLLVVDAVPAQYLPRLAEWCRGKGHPLGGISFNRDYEPFARRRDEEIARLMKKQAVPLHTERDHLIVEPEELFRDKPGSAYQIYTPFKRRWFSLMAEGEFRDRLDKNRVGLPELKKAAEGKREKQFAIHWKDLGKVPAEDALAAFIATNEKKIRIPIPEAGPAAAWKAVQEFRKKIDGYSANRDLPAMAGTSRFSVFFKNGSLTPAQAIAGLGLSDCTGEAADSRTKFFQEIVWREFYYHILFHHPRVEKEAFLTKYNDLKWDNDEELFGHWKAGTTGFPIVDAGMRELRATGWMHNRVRMIVASFLTKDLLIDWRWGEKFFMEELLDGDLAPNNGGWQWAASTGCDPQPYFRIFNPWLQAAKFDPEGEYIRKYVPELAKVKNLHKPEEVAKAYRPPIVDHGKQKQKAIALYKGE